MNLWDTLISWVDPIAEAIGYEDTVDIGAGLTTAGDYLTSDVLGFIKKGATAYSVLSGADSPKGYKKMPTIEGASHKKIRPLNQLTRGGTRTSFQTSQATGNPTYANPDVQSAFANLTATGKNVQMNNLLSQFAVSPNIRGGGQTVGIGSTNVKGITKRPVASTK
tara:strand:- start:2171 stop:2665 length:495 start_codon:yes stop_codon:yes gene_type:complete